MSIKSSTSIMSTHKNRDVKNYRIISLQCLLHYSHLPCACTCIMLIIRLHGIIHRKALAKAMKMAKYCIMITPLAEALLSDSPPLYTHPSIDESLCLWLVSNTWCYENNPYTCSYELICCRFRWILGKNDFSLEDWFCSYLCTQGK